MGSGWKRPPPLNPKPLDRVGCVCLQGRLRRPAAHHPRPCASRPAPSLQLRSAPPARPANLPPGTTLQTASSWGFNTAAGSPYVPVAELPAAATFSQFSVSNDVRGHGAGGLSVAVTANSGEDAVRSARRRAEPGGA